jgi:hypothetical protein
MIHDTCRSNWAKRVRTKQDLVSFNASMKELDEELDKLEEKHPQALEAMADECQLVHGDYAVRRRLALAQGEEL